MGEFSALHWLIVLAILTTAIPVARILSRTGHNSGWCVFCFFPLVNVILLWVFAFKASSPSTPNRSYSSRLPAAEE